MDGIVPIVYIVIFLGVVFCGLFFVLCAWLYHKGDKRLLVRTAKINCIFILLLFLLVVLSAETIVGYGSLKYIVFIQLITAIVVFRFSKNNVES